MSIIGIGIGNEIEIVIDQLRYNGYVIVGDSDTDSDIDLDLA